MNRLWSLLFGRGLVHPLDLQHRDNPASNPRLLALLANSFAELEFDIKAFLGQLARTRAYQRASTPPSFAVNAAEASEELEYCREQLDALRHTAKASRDAADAAERKALPARREGASGRARVSRIARVGLGLESASGRRGHGDRVRANGAGEAQSCARPAPSRARTAPRRRAPS